MPLISRQSIENLKLRVNIHDVVSPVVALKRAGKNFVGLSPFSNEKTPSFYVLPDKGIYKCFSSGNAGDIFKFVEETEKLSFVEAVEALAERFNFPLEYEDGKGPRKEDRSLRRELLEIHDYARDFFHQCFLGNDPDASAARDYWLNARGFPLDLAKDFGIGFAPANSQDLNELLVKKGFSGKAIRACGLFYDREQQPDPTRLRNRFRGRLMIPIRDTQNQVIAFTARQLEVTPEDDRTRAAKYINSPETPLFHKSNLVFNLERARLAVEQAGHFILVEGQLDAIRCWHSGSPSAVAPQGTSVTLEQMRLLRRHSSRLVVVLDGDNAGRKAALRLLPLALSVGLEATFAPLPPGEDPDSFIVGRGGEAFRDLVAQADTAMAFAAHALLPPDPSPRDRANAVNALFQILVECDSEVAREAYLDEAVDTFGIDPVAARRDFDHFLVRTRRRAPEPPPPASVQLPAGARKPKLTTAESDLALIVLHHGELAAPIAQLLDPTWIDHSLAEGRILGSVIAEVSEGHLDVLDDPEFLLDSADDRNTLFNLLADERRHQEPRTEANKALRRLYLGFLQKRVAALSEEISNTADDSPRFNQILDERRELKQAQLSSNVPRLPEV